MKKEDFQKNNNIIDEELQRRCLKQQMVVDEQEKGLKVKTLRHKTLYS